MIHFARARHFARRAAPPLHTPPTTTTHLTVHYRLPDTTTPTRFFLPPARAHCTHTDTTRALFWFTCSIDVTPPCCRHYHRAPLLLPTAPRAPYALPAPPFAHALRYITTCLPFFCSTRSHVPLPPHADSAIPPCAGVFISGFCLLP